MAVLKDIFQEAIFMYNKASKDFYSDIFTLFQEFLSEFFVSSNPNLLL